jgi:hypothetical protein
MKMNTPKKYLVVMGMILLIFSSCKDFLDVKPKGELIPEKLMDFELMFNGSTLTKLIPAELENATDDTYQSYGAEAGSKEANIYFWRKNLDNDLESTPQIWLSRYKTIYFCNYLINNVMHANDGSLQDKKILIAQAKAIRATSFLYLLTAFTKAYTPGQNPDDPGLSLVTSTNVMDVIPQRASLKETLSDMVRDLMEAIADLPEQHTDRWRVTRYGAAGILSRLYLYIHDYPKAKEYAILALSRPGAAKLLDYNTIPNTAAFPIPGNNVEKIWIDFSEIAESFLYTKELLSLYTKEDLRLKLFVNTGGRKVANVVSGGVGFPELYLIQAECLARENKPEEAIALVNQIRKNRLPANDPNLNLSATDAAQALILVLNERRRELAFCGLRWMDMKRLDMEDKMTVVNRYKNNDPTNTVIATLAPKSAAYTFEIPLKVQYLNPTIQRNY